VARGLSRVDHTVRWICVAPDFGLPFTISFTPDFVSRRPQSPRQD